MKKFTSILCLFVVCCLVYFITYYCVPYCVPYHSTYHMIHDMILYVHPTASETQKRAYSLVVLVVGEAIYVTPISSTHPVHRHILSSHVLIFCHQYKYSSSLIYPLSRPNCSSLALSLCLFVYAQSTVLGYVQYV